MSVNHHIYMKYRAFSLADGTRVKKRSLQQAAINRNSRKDAKIKKKRSAARFEPECLSGYNWLRVTMR